MKETPDYGISRLSLYVSYFFWDFFLRQLSQYAFILWDLRILSSLEKRDRFLGRADPAAAAEGADFTGVTPRSSRVISAISSSSFLFLFSSVSSANSNILRLSLGI
jgi:hypothetical protein